MIKDSICVVIPVYNAQRTLEELTEKLMCVLSQFSSYKIVFVDDASTDRSFETLRKLKESNDNITAIKLKENAGQQAAILCGLRQSECDYTVIMDDDLENDPGDIMKLYERITQGPDVVYGVCAQPTKGALRSFGSGFRQALITSLSGKPKQMKVCSFSHNDERYCSESQTGGYEVRLRIAGDIEAYKEHRQHRSRLLYIAQDGISRIQPAHSGCEDVCVLR